MRLARDNLLMHMLITCCHPHTPSEQTSRLLNQAHKQARNDVEKESTFLRMTDPG